MNLSDKTGQRHWDWRRHTVAPVLVSFSFCYATAQTPLTPSAADRQTVAASPQTTLTHQMWRDSLQVLTRQVAQGPWSTELHLRKAAVHIELQQWQYAADEYASVLDREPDNLAALFYRAYAYGHLRRYEPARRDLERLLQHAPHHTAGRLSLAYVLQQMSLRQEALDQLNTCVELSPDSAVAYAARAALEQELRQVDAAVYDWQQAMRLNPQSGDYVASCVKLLISERRYTEARRELDAATRRGIPQGWLQGYYQQLKKRKRGRR